VSRAADLEPLLDDSPVGVHVSSRDLVTGWRRRRSRAPLEHAHLMAAAVD
jgi:hypothetical protein